MSETKFLLATKLRRLFVIQIKRDGRWQSKPTFWTRGGKSVSARAAKLALSQARESFPEEEFRVKEVFPGKAKK
jgi:hypothetical protein